MKVPVELWEDDGDMENGPRPICMGVVFDRVPMRGWWVIRLFIRNWIRFIFVHRCHM